MRRLLCFLVVLSLMAVGCSEGGSAVDWGINVDEGGPGVHTVRMIVDFGPEPEKVEETSGRLIWDEAEVELCRVGIRAEVEEGSLGVGDVFQTTEGCGANPTAMQDAFDEFGLPEEGCIVVRFDGVDHEFCSPLS